jgi:hypothetical protein
MILAALLIAASSASAATLHPARTSRSIGAACVPASAGAFGLPEQIARLDDAKFRLGAESKRLDSPKALSAAQAKAVARYEGIDGFYPDRGADVYQARVGGLASYVDIELRRRKAALLYQGLRAGIPASAGLDESMGTRLIQRVLSRDAEARPSASELLALFEIQKLEATRRDLEDEKEKASSGSESLDDELRDLKRELDKLERAKTEEGYRKVYGLTAESHAQLSPTLLKRIAAVEAVLANRRAAAAPRLAALKERLDKIEEGQATLFKESGSSFKDLSGMRYAASVPDKVGGCCGKGCWNCPLSPELRSRRHQEAAGDREPAPRVFSQSNPAPDLPLYRIKAELKSLLPYLQ